jgi:hypothetical protein
MFTIENAPTGKALINFYRDAAGRVRARRFNRNRNVWFAEKVEFAQYLLEANKAVLVKK